MEGNDIVYHIHDHILGNRVKKALKGNLEHMKNAYPCKKYHGCWKSTYWNQSFECIIPARVPGVTEIMIPAMSIVSMNIDMITKSSEHPTILIRSWCIHL